MRWSICCFSYKGNKSFVPLRRSKILRCNNSKETIWLQIFSYNLRQFTEGRNTALRTESTSKVKIERKCMNNKGLKEVYEEIRKDNEIENKHVSSLILFPKLIQTWKELKSDWIWNPIILIWCRLDEIYNKFKPISCSGCLLLFFVFLFPAEGPELPETIKSRFKVWGTKTNLTADKRNQKQTIWNKREQRD